MELQLFILKYDLTHEEYSLPAQIIELKTSKLLFIICFLMLTIFSEGISNAVVLLPNNQTYTLKKPFLYFIDKTNSLSIDSVASPHWDNKFKLIYEDKLDNDYAAAHWLKIVVKNESNNEQLSWYLESFDFTIDELKFYSKLSNGKWQESQTGFNLDFNVRRIFHKNPVYELDVKPGEEKAFYLKLRTRFSHLLMLKIRSNEVFIRYAIKEYWTLGLFYGIQLLIIFINFYLFFRLRDRSFLFYVLTVTSQIIYCFGRDGLGFQFFWPDVPFFNTIIYRFAQFSMIVFTILYSSSFLKTKLYLPRLHNAMMTAIFVRFGVLLITTFISLDQEYLLVIDAIILSLPFLAGILVLNKGIRYVTNFVVGFTFLYICFGLIALHAFKLIDFSPIDWYFINIGIFAQSIFISMALLEQFSYFKEQNERSQKKIIDQLMLTEQLKDEMNYKLTQMVDERTKELEEKNNTLDAFVYRASHDIKGPLNSIIGLTNIALKESEGTKYKEYFDHINKNSIRLKNLVTDLLQLSRVEQQGPEKKEIDIASMLDEIILSFSNLPDFNRVKISKDLPAVSKCFSDERMVYSILQNLTENAIKYQDKSKSTSILNIRIEVTKESFLFIFEDNGLGIPEEVKGRIFDMFYKVENSSNGTGLGLYIVKTSVQKLGGTIELDTQLGRGSIFTVQVPLI